MFYYFINTSLCSHCVLLTCFRNGYFLPCHGDNISNPNSADSWRHWCFPVSDWKSVSVANPYASLCYIYCSCLKSFALSRLAYMLCRIVLIRNKAWYQHLTPYLYSIFSKISLQRLLCSLCSFLPFPRYLRGLSYYTDLLAHSLCFVLSCWNFLIACRPIDRWYFWSYLLDRCQDRENPRGFLVLSFEC